MANRIIRTTIVVILLSWMSGTFPVRAADSTVEIHYRLTADGEVGELFKATPEPIRPTGTGFADDPYEYDLRGHTLDMEGFRIRAATPEAHTRIRVRSLLFNPFGDGGVVDFSMADPDVPDETDAAGLTIDSTGSIWIRSIDTSPSHRGIGGPVSLTAADVIWILEDVMTGHGPASSGSAGEVDIRSEIGPVVVEGNIVAWYRRGADVTISGTSVDLHGDVEARSFGDGVEAGRIKLVATDGPVRVRGTVRTDPASAHARPTNVTISATAGDLIVDGDIHTYVLSTREEYRGGAVRMSAVGGDIHVKGRIDSSRHARPDARDERGDLELVARDGAITLAGLDVDRHGRIALEADAYRGTTIQGELLGLEGAVHRGVIDRFESVSGNIYYDDTLPENTYLKGAAYRIELSDERSFYLMPIPVPPSGWAGEGEYENDR